MLFIGTIGKKTNEIIFYGNKENLFNQSDKGILHQNHNLHIYVLLPVIIGYMFYCYLLFFLS